MDLLKQLRGETGAPLGDVKEALALAFSETGSFDLATARDNLRKKGMATAAKRAGKEATEGMVSHHRVGRVHTNADSTWNSSSPL